MMRPLLIVAAAAAWLLAAASTHAQVTLSLESGGPDVAQLYVGQTATVDVRLDGLQPGWQLDALAATVLYDESLLSAPTISPGPIVPNPLADPFDFLVWEEPGIAEGFFLTMGTEPSEFVATNGTFFSFDFVDASTFNPADPFDPIPLNPLAGAPLPFIVVPEPTTVSLVLVFVSLWLASMTVRPTRRKWRQL